MKKMVLVIGILFCGFCYGAGIGQITVTMSDEVRGIAGVADEWHGAWRGGDRDTFVGLMRHLDPKIPGNMFGYGERLFAVAEGGAEKCLMVSRTDEEPLIATVHFYPMSIGGRETSFEVSMTKQGGKWYVLAAKYVGVDDLVSHWRRWAEKYDTYEIWYDADAPEGLRPGQKGSEVAGKIAEINVSDSTIYGESYGQLLAGIRKELSEGSRLQRSQLLKVIREKRVSRLFDESFVGPLRACLESDDAEVVKLARKMYGELKKKIRKKRETDASKIPQSEEEFRALADKYNAKVIELDKVFGEYRSKQIFRDFVDAIEKEIFPFIHKGRIAGDQKGEMRKQDPDVFKKSTYDQKESEPAVIDICAAVMNGLYEKFGAAVEEGVLRLPYGDQEMIFYRAGVMHFQTRQKLVGKPYEEHCPYDEGTMEYYQFMDAAGQCCVMVSSPLMVMVKQLPEELEDAKEEVEIMYKWLEAGRGKRGEVAMPEVYKEAYLNEIDELAVKEGLL